MYGGSMAQRKIGKMSQYIRKQQNAIRSIKGSACSGFQSMHQAKQAQASGAAGQGIHGLRNLRAANIVNDFEHESQNQRMFIKYQTKKHIGNQSDYRGGGMSNRQHKSSDRSIDMSSKDIVINDDESDGSSVFERQGDVQSLSFQSQSQYGQARSIRSRIQAARARRGDQTSFKGSMRSSLRGSVRSGSRRGGPQNRVQVISDFESEASIDEMEQSDLLGINQDIQEHEKNELINKRMHNDYDLMGLANPEQEHYQKIHAVI